MPTRPTADVVEGALVSERLARLEQHEIAEHEVQAELLACARSTDAGVRQLVELAQRDDARKEEALTLERDRSRASQEAELRRTEAEITERSERGRWIRANATPLFVGLGTALAAAGSALAAWLSGAMGGK